MNKYENTLLTIETVMADDVQYHITKLAKMIDCKESPEWLNDLLMQSIKLGVADFLETDGNGKYEKKTEFGI